MPTLYFTDMDLEDQAMVESEEDDIPQEDLQGIKRPIDQVGGADEQDDEPHVPPYDMERMVGGSVFSKWSIM